MSKRDEVIRSYALLISLRENVPDRFEVSEDSVKEYHFAIEKLERTLGRDLGDFKVASKHLQRSVAAIDRSGAETYREGLWCQRAVLMQKLDAVLTYFTGLQSGSKIGFEPPE